MSTIEHPQEAGRVWKAYQDGGQYRPEACRPFFQTLARASVWQTPTLVPVSESAVIGTPTSRISPEHFAYASKQSREL